MADTSIAKAIKGERNSAGGFVWRKYTVDDKIPEEIEILFDTTLVNSGKAKKVAKINSEGIIIETYDSLTEAAKANGTKKESIKTKIEKNIEWKYIE